MESIYCQSCGMLLENSSQYGTHADYSKTEEYCNYCYQGGEFTEDCTMEEMILHCVEYLDEFNEGSQATFSREEAIREMRKHFPTLKRWQQKQETEEYYHQAVNKVIDYINLHLFDPIDLKKLSEISHISLYHFHRIFKSIIGESIGTYLQRIRLEHIAHKLKNTDLTLSEITDHTHYETPYALSKAFKKHFGVAPTLYRKMATLPVPSSETQDRNWQEIDMRIEEVPSQEVVYLSINYSERTKNGFAGLWKRLYQFVQVHNLQKPGEHFLSFSFDDPLITRMDKSRYYLCHTIKHPVKPTGKVGTMTIEGGTYAVFRSVGHYSRLFNLYEQIYTEWLPASDYLLRDSFTFEMYIENPRTTDEGNYITDVYVPVRKK